MRPKYSTEAIVLSRFPLAESSARLTLLTPDIGLVSVVAQGLRKGNAKLAHALQTLSEADVVLVRGKDVWRLSGAVLAEPWFQKLDRDARLRAGRVTALLLRLVKGEAADHRLYAAFRGFLEALASAPDTEHDAIETLAALRMLHILGLDAGVLPGGEETYDASTLAIVARDRRDLVLRVNRGILASGL